MLLKKHIITIVFAFTSLEIQNGPIWSSNFSIHVCMTFQIKSILFKCWWNPYDTCYDNSYYWEVSLLPFLYSFFTPWGIRCPPPPTWRCSQRGLSGLIAPPAAGVRILTGLTQSTHELQIQGHAHNPNQSDLTELWLDFPGQWPALSSVCSMRCDAWGCSSHFANSEEVSLRIADRSDGQVI